MSQTHLPPLGTPGRDGILRRWVSQHRTHRIQWGHWFRVMKRRTHPKTLMFLCKDCGDELHVEEE